MISSSLQILPIDIVYFFGKPSVLLPSKQKTKVAIYKTHLEKATYPVFKCLLHDGASHQKMKICPMIRPMSWPMLFVLEYFYYADITQRKKVRLNLPTANQIDSMRYFAQN